MAHLAGSMSNTGAMKLTNTARLVAEQEHFLMFRRNKFVWGFLIKVSVVVSVSHEAQ